MLTLKRRHDHARVNARLNRYPQGLWGSGYEWGNTPGRGKFWRSLLNRAKRRYWRAQLRGDLHPHYPSGLESEVSWRAD